MSVTTVYERMIARESLPARSFTASTPEESAGSLAPARSEVFAVVLALAATVAVVVLVDVVVMLTVGPVS